MTGAATEATEKSLAAIERLDGKLHAFASVLPAHAREQARHLDAMAALGVPPGPLYGEVVGVKDLIDLAGLPTGGGSRTRANTPPAARDARIIRRLRAAGAVMIGKTNTVEYAYGGWGTNVTLGTPRNPWDMARHRIPGGSSSGSGVAVAAGIVPMALGSDTGGSVRQPASFCGVVGVTPTYGRVSRYGLVAYASSLDHIGPFARNVRDAAIALEVMAGRDPLDSTSASAPVPDYAAALTGEVRGMKLGVPVEYMKHATGETAALMNSAIGQLRGLGCDVREISLPSTDYAVAAYYIISTAEASSNLARFDGARYTARSPHSGTLGDMYRNTRGEGFGAEVKLRIMLGTYVLSHGYYDAYYVKAQKVRALITRDFTNAFESVDAIVAPVSPFPAFRIGEKVNDPIQMYLSDIYTITGSLAGIPCMSVPCGMTGEGLPVGLQILCNHFEERKMFRLADAFEKR